MALIEAIVVGAVAGALVESGKRGLLAGRGRTAGLPPVIKLLMVAILFGIPLIGARTVTDFVNAALVTVGAFTVSRWSVASLIVVWGWRRG